jgi:hypothetical protein
MTRPDGASPEPDASADELEPGASRLARYAVLDQMIASGITDVDTLTAACGLRRWEVQNHVELVLFTRATRAKPKTERRWKPRFFRKRPVGE